MRVTVELRRPARRTLIVLVALVLLAVPGTALASHLFPDVGNTHPFHAEIGAIAEAGITAGFNDGGYHPSDVVTRQAMAAFLERGLGHIVHDGDDVVDPSIDLAPGNDFSTDLVAKEMTITVPGATNSFQPEQLVYVYGRLELIGAMGTTGAGCPCEFGLVIRDVQANEVSRTSGMTFESSTTNVGSYSLVADTVFVLPPGQRTFQLIITLLDRFNTTSSVSWNISESTTLTAMTFPFGEDVIAD